MNDYKINDPKYNIAELPDYFRRIACCVRDLLATVESQKKLINDLQEQVRILSVEKDS